MSLKGMSLTQGDDLFAQQLCVYQDPRRFLMLFYLFQGLKIPAMSSMPSMWIPFTWNMTPKDQHRITE